jgi:hypothetical protein
MFRPADVDGWRRRAGAIPARRLAADCLGMRQGVSFAEVLDATLRGYQPETAVRQGPPPVRPGAPVPPNPFLFTFTARPAFAGASPLMPDAIRIGVPFGDGATRAGSRVQSGASAPRAEGARFASSAPVVEPPPARPTVAPAPPRRRLTPAQQRSLDAFVDAGVPLGPDFSADEVRSAYRRLARRYHPDRHPLASDAEKAALSRRFVAITTDYDVLLTALEPAVC